MLTDAAKATVWSAIYEPFGRVHSVTGAVTQNLDLPGQWFQLGNGVACNWHRHYDAPTGRDNAEQCSQSHKLRPS